MNRMSTRRVSRLEKLAAAVIAERKRREPEVLAWRRQAARDHATKLVTLILHGDPHIDEPLAIAWNRALGHLGLIGIPEAELPDRLRTIVVASLPDDTENAKFARVLCSAPSWLLHFCMASLDRFVLGIELPKNSEPAPECGRDGLRDMKSWPDLPTGTIGAGRLIPKPNPLRALSLEECVELIGLLKSGEENWSRQDRRRHSEIMAKVDNEELSRALMPVQSGR
jgi:hypothetical protein